MLLLLQCTVRAASVLHDKLFKTLLLSPMRFFDTTPLGRILNRFSRDMDEGEEPLSFSAHKSFQMRDDGGRLKAFWCLALSHIGSLFFSLHSWRASVYASRNAAPECDTGAVLSGSGRRSVSVVPVLHHSFRGVPLHCQPNLQVWSIRFLLKETDSWVGSM